VVFFGIDSNFAMRNSTSDLSIVHYPTCRRIIRPLDVLHINIAISIVGLALQVLKFARVDDSRRVVEVPNRETAQ
jgi:hypothetical protein